MKKETIKNVSLDADKRDILAKALNSVENEKLNLYKSIVGGNDDGGRCPAGSGIAYADTVYASATVAS